ncbi:MAG TPA: hypothetical protein VFA98_11145 [Thermoanaerobaculia bacterium]|jgi:hypothetical protein|nr:hypothetical protein [Thermoanaerobaculia bacterium]
MADDFDPDPDPVTDPDASDLDPDAPEHDPEAAVRDGMSTAASGVDAGETMASTGNEDDSFFEIAAGTATGLGLDRGESVGTGGLAAGEDRDDVQEGESWLEDKSGAPDDTAERFPAEGEPYGWERAADLEPRRTEAGVAGFDRLAPQEDKGEEGEVEARGDRGTKRP